MIVRVYHDIELDPDKEGIDSMSDLEGWLCQTVSHTITQYVKGTGEIDDFWEIFSKVVLME